MHDFWKLAPRCTIDIQSAYSLRNIFTPDAIKRLLNPWLFPWNPDCDTSTKAPNEDTIDSLNSPSHPPLLQLRPIHHRRIVFWFIARRHIHLERVPRILKHTSEATNLQLRCRAGIIRRCLQDKVSLSDLHGGCTRTLALPLPKTSSVRSRTSEPSMGSRCSRTAVRTISSTVSMFDFATGTGISSVAMVML
jgi:hypothetical protein